MLRKLFISFCFTSFALAVNAQRMTPQDYIAKFKEIAIEEMHRTGVPASITLAQGLLETESGNSDLLQRSNNHFGIKCKSDWQGESVSHTDDAPNECFRKYSSDRDSYADHSNFLRKSGRYSSLFTLAPTDYKGWAEGLKRAGYATNPRYPSILIGNIEQYQLYQYDMDVYDPSRVFAQGLFKDSANETKQLTMQPVAPKEEIVTATIDNSRKFNGLKAVFVNANTSLLAIATKAQISLGKLLEFNDLQKDGLLSEAQYIYLERKSKAGNKDFYVAGSRETLYDISQTNGVQLNLLAQYNDLIPEAAVKAGTKIKLRPGI